MARQSRHFVQTMAPKFYHPLPTCGDGSPIETADLELALSIAEDMRVNFVWQKCDVVLLDNYAVMYSWRE